MQAIDSTQPMKKFIPMKTLLTTLAICCTAIFTSSCGGPSKADLRAELQMVENEMMQLNSQAYNLKSQMNQAEWQSLFGGFAAGFGATSGDGTLALDGAGVVVNAAGNYDRAKFNYNQIVTIQVYFPSASFLPRDFGDSIRLANVLRILRDCLRALDMIPRISQKA